MADNGKAPSGDAERYKQAAHDALEMLDWCIGFPVGTRKEASLRGWRVNRSSIRE
jgi:hypothetical protein